MEEIMIGSIPMGSVCIELTEYRELLESKTRAESLEKETEAAYNRGFADGKTAAYEDYLSVLVAKKKTPTHRKTPDKPETKEDPSPENLAETIAAITKDDKTAERPGITDRVKTKVCQDRMKGKARQTSPGPMVLKSRPCARFWTPRRHRLRDSGHGDKRRIVYENYSGV